MLTIGHRVGALAFALLALAPVSIFANDNPTSRLLAMEAAAEVRAPEFVRPYLSGALPAAEHGTLERLAAAGEAALADGDPVLAEKILRVTAAGWGRAEPANPVRQAYAAYRLGLARERLCTSDPAMCRLIAEAGGAPANDVEARIIDMVFLPFSQALRGPLDETHRADARQRCLDWHRRYHPPQRGTMLGAC